MVPRQDWSRSILFKFDRNTSSLSTEHSSPCRLLVYMPFDVDHPPYDRKWVSIYSIIRLCSSSLGFAHPRALGGGERQVSVARSHLSGRNQMQ